MTSINEAPRRYIGILFKEAPPTGGFSCSTEIALPSEHTGAEAWAAVRRALQDSRCIGGEVQPC